ncbi:MAG: hypothetical protein WBD50_07915 [Candidatus Rhabdochlamydia sp.]
MTSYVTSTDVLNTSLNNTNSPIQIGEISSTISILSPNEESNVYKAEIDHLFNKIFNLCAEIKKNQNKSSKLIALDPLFSEENLNQTLNPSFTKTLLEETKKEGICSSLEQDPCYGEYWKDLHRKNKEDNTEFSLQDLKKIRLCLESFSYPIPKTVEEMLVLIKAKFITESII